MNEARIRTLQRMHLHMSAPLEIGVERTDDVLRDGQSDFFVPNVEIASEGSHTAAEEDHQTSNESSDDEDKDARTDSVLERELDTLYDAYKTRIAEKDSKVMANESRKKNKDRDLKWNGIGEESGTDGISDDDWISTGGGKSQQMSELSDTDDDSEDMASHNKRKRRRVEPNLRRELKDGVAAERSELQAAAVWFNQKIFNALDSNINEIQHSDDEDSTTETVNSFQLYVFMFADYSVPVA